MKIKGVLFLIALLVLSACYNVEKPQKPDNLIPENEMVNILIDISVLASAKSVNKSKLENNGIVPEEYVYNKNNIDSATFAQSNAYYAFYVKKYETIYLRVKDSLTILRDNFKAIETKEKKEKEIKDSIRREKINAKKRINYDKNTNSNNRLKGKTDKKTKFQSLKDVK